MSDAYNVGYNDGWGDDPENKNPYPKGSREWGDYEQGFSDARQDW